MVIASGIAHADSHGRSFAEIAVGAGDFLVGDGGNYVGPAMALEVGESITRRLQIVPTIGVASDNPFSDGSGSRAADANATVGLRIVPFLHEALANPTPVAPSALVLTFAAGLNARVLEAYDRGRQYDSASSGSSSIVGS